MPYLWNKLKKLLDIGSDGKPAAPPPDAAELVKQIHTSAPVGSFKKYLDKFKPPTQPQGPIGKAIAKAQADAEKAKQPPSPPGQPGQNGQPPGEVPDWSGRAGIGGKEIPKDETESFLSGELVLFLSSSWLSYAVYHPAEQELEVGILHPVQCKGLVASQVDSALAKSFIAASSKGSWWWQNCFVAGEGTGRGMGRETRRPVRWL